MAPKVSKTDSSFHVKWREFPAASVNKAFILARGLGARLSRYGV